MSNPNQQSVLGRLLERDEKCRNYFNSLPPIVQESLMQSSVAPTGLQELQKCSREFMGE